MRLRREAGEADLVRGEITLARRRAADERRRRAHHGLEGGGGEREAEERAAPLRRVVAVAAAALVEGDGARCGTAVEAQQQRPHARMRQHGAPLEGVERHRRGRQGQAAAQQAARGHRRRQQVAQ